MPLSFGYNDIASTICIVAGIVYFIKRQYLNESEKLVLFVLLLNILTDTVAYFLFHMEMKANFIYNFLLPAERIITLLIYSQNETNKTLKKVNTAGMIGIALIYLAGFIRSDILSDFHVTSYILTSFIVAALSYLHLRSISVGKAKNTVVVLSFAVANFIYSTISVSAMSAIPLAIDIDMGFASDLFFINLIGYSLWSIILIIGILWKKQN